MNQNLFKMLAFICGIMLFQTYIALGQDCEVSYIIFTQEQFGAQCNANNGSGPVNNPGVDPANNGNGPVNNPHLGNGIDAGCYLDQNFENVLPYGISVGCPNGIQIHFATVKDVKRFLPAKGTPGVFTNKDKTENPTTTSAGELAGQLLTLKLNVIFDHTDPTLSPKAHDPLGHFPINIPITSPSSAPFSSFIVTSFLDIADEVIGGCRTDLSFIRGTTRIYYTIDDILQTAKVINESYATQNRQINPLICPSFVEEVIVRPADPAAPAAPAAPADPAIKAKLGYTNNTAINSTSSLTSYPNPFNDNTSIEINLNYDSPVTMQIYNYSGELVSTEFTGNVRAYEKKVVNFNGSRLNEGAYYCKVSTSQGNLISKLILIK